MTKADIDHIYTEKVSELLAQGYQIHTGTMGGSQGEIAHIDLTNGSEILRVLLDRESDWGEACGDYFVIRVGRSIDTLHDSWSDTIWNDRMETLSEIKLAKVTDSYFTTMEEGAAISRKRLARWEHSAKADTAHRALSEAYKSVALRWIQKQPRMKSCKLEDIESVARLSKSAWGKVLPDLDCYEIKAKGKRYTLRAARA